MRRMILTGASGSGAVGVSGCVGAGWLSVSACQLVSASVALVSSCLHSPGNRCTEAMFAEAVWRLGEVFALAGTVTHHVLCAAVALAGHLRGTIRQQLDIAGEHQRNRLIHTAVALWQLGLRLLGDRCHSFTPGSPCTEVRRRNLFPRELFYCYH